MMLGILLVSCTWASQYDLNSNPRFVIEREISQRTSMVKVFTSQQQYDAQDRPYLSIDPLMHQRQVGYDSRGNATVMTDAEGNTAACVFDGLSRVTQRVLDLRTGGTGGGSIYDQVNLLNTWDANSRLAQQRDDNSNPTSTQFDAQDRPEHLQMADQTCTESAFSPTGVALTITQPNGTIIQVVVIDDLDRVTHRTIQQGGGIGGETYQKFTYDGQSRIVKAENDHYLVETTYDSLSRVLEEKLTEKATARVYVTGYETDGVGNVLACTYPNGRRITREHNALNQLDKIRENGGSVIADYSYEGPSRVEERISGNGVSLSLVYDGGRRATQLLHQGPSGVVGDFRYGYDQEDHRLYEQRIHQGGYGDRFGYDSL